MNTSERVEAMLRAADLSRVSAAQVAGALRMSGTTLRRKLRDEGTNYSRLLEAERKRRCGLLLEERGRRCYGKIVAAEIGMELNSFYRAFKAWHGTGFTEARIG